MSMEQMTSGAAEGYVEENTFKSSPEVLKGGRKSRRRNRGKKSRKSRGKTRGGGNGVKLPFMGGRSRRKSRGRKRR